MGNNKDLYVLQVQHTAGAYQPMGFYYRESDAIDVLKAIAAMNPDYPYDGKSWKYAVGSSVHHKDRYRILKNPVIGEQKSLTGLNQNIKI